MAICKQGIFNIETDDNGNIIQIDYEGGSVRVPFEKTINIHYLYKQEDYSELENLLAILIEHSK
jgi:hypothetical protein